MDHKVHWPMLSPMSLQITSPSFTEFSTMLSFLFLNNGIYIFVILLVSSSQPRWVIVGNCLRIKRLPKGEIHIVYSIDSLVAYQNQRYLTTWTTSIGLPYILQFIYLRMFVSTSFYNLSRYPLSCHIHQSIEYTFTHFPYLLAQHQLLELNILHAAIKKGLTYTAST